MEEGKMSEVVAALIIACSNLTSGYPGVATQEDWAKKKSQCIQRVSECAAKKTEDNFN